MTSDGCAVTSTRRSLSRYDNDGVARHPKLILLSRLDDAARLPDEPLICTIALAELSVGPLAATTPEERAARQIHLQQAEADFEPLAFDAAAARAFGCVAASLRQRGRKPAAGVSDALIAPVAIAHGLPVYTCNPDDFRGIADLTVHDVPHPDRAAV